MHFAVDITCERTLTKEMKPMAYRGRRNLDGLYGVGAEHAGDGLDYNEIPTACANCGETYPDSALDSSGFCQECCLHRRLEAAHRREAYFREEDWSGVFDGYGVMSEADHGL